MSILEKHVVTLTAEERSELHDLVTKGRAAASKRSHAQILLKADAGPLGEGWTDVRIAEALDVGTATVARVRKRLVEEGLDAALNPRQQANRRRKIDGRAEAQLIATACSKPPEGYSRWSLRMLGERLVELKCVDSISHEAIRQKLKKTSSSRG